MVWCRRQLPTHTRACTCTCCITGPVGGLLVCSPPPPSQSYTPSTYTHIVEHTNSLLKSIHSHTALACYSHSLLLLATIPLLLSYPSPSWWTHPESIHAISLSATSGLEGSRTSATAWGSQGSVSGKPGWGHYKMRWPNSCKFCTVSERKFL